MVSLRSGRVVGDIKPSKVSKPRAQKPVSQTDDSPEVQEQEDVEKSANMLQVTEKMAEISIQKSPMLSPIVPSSSKAVAKVSSQKPVRKVSPLVEAPQETSRTPAQDLQIKQQDDTTSHLTPELSLISDNPKASVASSPVIPENMSKTPLQRPSTPPRPFNPFDSELAGEPNYEKTPGRVGRIGQTDFSLKPDIKPFKGPKGQKERKSHEEIEEEWGQFALDNENTSFHNLHVCFKKGRSGSPTYDKAGFELDFDKVAHWMNPSAYSKPKIIRNMIKSTDSRMDESRLMADIFFVEGEAPTGPGFWSSNGYWKDRVSKDLNIPWHSVDVDDFREWEKRGYEKARKGEYETHTEKEKARMSRMLGGASLRK